MLKTAMKKTMCYVCAAAAAMLIIVAAAVPGAAANASVNVTGTSTVRAGNTITLAVNMSGSGLYAVQGTLSYDSSILTYAGYSGTPSGWAFTISGGGGTVSFLGYDDNQTSPINSGKTIFYVAFTVSGSVSPGTAIKVTPSGVTGSDGTADIPASASGYSVSVAAPLSSNCNLSSLSLSSDGGSVSVSPAFSQGTTWYSATIPYSVDSVSVSASVADSGASYTVSGNRSLSVGTNSVYVTVTAASGAQKTYTIALTREPDPDYKPSDNARLSDINVSVGVLSPSFSPEITKYVLYLPYEVDVLSVSGTPEDSLAMGAEDVSDMALEEGGNTVALRSVAEDGVTEIVYYISVYRMPVFTGTTVTEATTLPPETTAPPETEATTTLSTTVGATSAETTLPLETTAESSGGSDGLLTDGKLPVWLVIVVGILCVMAGFGCCFGILWQKRDR